MNDPGPLYEALAQEFLAWADPRAVAGLKSAFAHYDSDDVWRALEATTDLFRWLARETAAKLGLTYPAEADRAATEIVLSLRPEVS